MNTVSKGEMKMGEIVIAQIFVNGVTAVASRLKKIPKGIIGATIQLTFGDDWEGLTKTAVFQGAVTKDVLIDDDTITIPAECVAQSGHRLKVGFYGVADGTLVIPTIWKDLGMIQDATDPSGDTTTDPTLPVWAQLQDQLAGITGGETATGVQINLNAHTSNKANPHGVTAEQVGARPDTWLPSLEDINAAPGGYGLGVAQTFTAAEIDNISRPGFYDCSEQMTIAGHTSSRWWMEVFAYGTGTTFATQRICSFWNGKGCVAERHKVNGDWKEWGWVNPPLELGKEYRTTETVNGKAVWTVYANIGTMSSSPMNVRLTQYPATEVVRYMGTCRTTTIPSIYGDINNGWTIYAFVNLNNGAIQARIYAGSEFTNRAVYMQFWYTKD